MVDLFFRLALLVPLALAAPQCKNPAGKNVEWSIVYKLPKTKPLKGSSHTPQGGEMAYIDSTMKNAKGWLLLKASVFETKGNPIAATLASIRSGQKNKDSLYVVYNDQPPSSGKSAKGHTKGVVHFDKNAGYWLVHSVPRFPYNVSSTDYEYPESGRENGQLFMCITLRSDQLDKVAAALRQQYPLIYESDAPKNLFQSESVDLLLQKKFVRKPQNPVVAETLTGLSGTEFVSFAKHHSFNDEIYTKVIAPHVEADLLVETWRNGAGGKLNSTCPLKGYIVTNMADVVIKFTDGAQVDFSTTEDHSKWAVSSNPSKPWFCAGSLNRMLSQYTRGGQTICIRNKLVHKSFTSSVNKCDLCHKEGSAASYCQQNVNK